jgi:Zn-finger nucleic acid-binding protein
MEHASYDAVKVDRCTNCKGLWFDSGELEELRKDTWMADYILDEGDAKLGKQYDHIRDFDCPECGERMKEESDSGQPHILYEICPNGHGSFLDAGEFTDMVNVTFWDRFKSPRR